MGRYHAAYHAQVRESERRRLELVRESKFYCKGKISGQVRLVTVEVKRQPKQ